MKSNNVFDKYRYYVKRKINIILQGLNPSQIEGRFKGPKVILNSLPKSGTHLIETLFFELPLMRHYGGRTIMINAHDNSCSKNLKRVEKIKKGQFIPAHIQFLPILSEIIKTEDIKFGSWGNLVEVKKNHLKA
jgi:hypothetical protein